MTECQQPYTFFSAVELCLEFRGQVREAGMGLYGAVVVQCPHLDLIFFAANGVWIGVDDHPSVVSFGNLQPFRIGPFATQQQEGDQEEALHFLSPEPRRESNWTREPGAASSLMMPVLVGRNRTSSTSWRSF